MHVQQYINPHFTSNTYLITTAKSSGVWLVDLGALDQVLKYLGAGQSIIGVLLTHYHYDHIHGINLLAETFSFCPIYASSHSIEGLYDPKQNLSFYHEDPIIYKSNKAINIADIGQLLLWDSIPVQAIATPGHNPGCISFMIGNYLFTGDSYIPHIDIVTKLRGGNKVQAKESTRKLLNLMQDDTIICPGHHSMTPAVECRSHMHQLLSAEK